MNKYQSILLGGLLLFSTSVVQAQGMYNKGNMYVGGSTSAAVLYIKTNFTAGGTSAVKQIGKTVLTGHFKNNVTDGHVFSDRSGAIEFRGTSLQNISGKASKVTNYIEFPNTFIVNMNTSDAAQSVVVVDTTMGIAIKNVEFKKGRVMVNSAPHANVAGGTTGIGHVFTEKGANIAYKHNLGGVNEGMFHVNLLLGKNHEEGRLVGFASPFKVLYTDYFFYNFLSEPGTSGLFDKKSDAVWITTPRKALKPGAGYVLGMGLVKHDNATWYANALDPQWTGALYSDVAKTAFHFARKFGKPSYRQFVNAADSVIGEELNITDVTIPITVGYNYLGNPFLTPIDLSSFISNPVGSGFGGFAAGEMDPHVYLLSTGTGKYEGSELKFTTTFITVSEVGGTFTGGTPQIAPMQMFIVKKNTNGTNNFTIPLDKRAYGPAPFLRSSNEPKNEILIETKDMVTGGFDRLCVVFRQDGTLKSTHKYDAEKLFNNTGGVNQIYTRSSDNKKLTTNVIPLGTQSLAMYLEPSAQQQEIKLTVDRMKSLTNVGSVILEDKQAGKKVDLKKEQSYTFLSSPSDKADRFVFHFSGFITGIEDVQVKELSAHYGSGIITIQGIGRADVGNNLSIYNVQGQLLYRQRVANEGTCTINKSLDKGIYIVRIDGNTTVLKLSVK